MTAGFALSMRREMGQVYGIGNPLLDVLLRGTAAQLQEFGAVPGSMNLVEAELQKRIIESCREISRRPGGSAANTVRAAAWLAGGASGHTFRYSGAVGDDAEGRSFAQRLLDNGVQPQLAISASSTGTSAIVVTPDSERTMFTSLGACRDLAASHLDLKQIAGCDILHTTGYMWDTVNQEHAAKESIKAANARGTRSSLDVADSFVVERYGDDLRSWMPGRIDLLFANEAELRVLTGNSSAKRETLMYDAQRYAPIVVMKVGKEGCVINDRGKLTSVPGASVEVRDTTGAGDSFAGAFLYGVLSGWNIERCARLANQFAAEVVGVDGCDFDGISRSLLEI